MKKMKRFLGIGMAIMIAVVLMVAIMAPEASAAYSVKKVYLRFSGTSGEALATGNVVCLKDSDGYVYKADANDASLRPAVGIVGSKSASASGQSVEVIVVGVLSGWSSLSENGSGYLSETAAAVTQSAPSYAQILGFAINTTDYLINCRSYFDTSAITSLGVLSGASPIILEGATADDYETTIAVTDPTADNTVTLADGAGTVMLSSLATNAVDAANAVTGASNGLVYEGATADDYETTITATDPTADRTVTLPDAGGTAMLSSLATNGADAANAVTGASNGLVYEGATADDYETTVTATDPTADRTITLPDAGGTAMLSSLATNGADAANAVTGASNGLVYEGATADDYETTVSSTDPTADNTLTLPDDSGAVGYSPGGGTTVDADELAIPITHSYVAKTTGADAEALTLANGENGQVLTIDLDTDGGGDGTLSPTTCSGFTSIVFADAGDNATLKYVDDTVGWIILGLAGVAAPPVTVD